VYGDVRGRLDGYGDPKVWGAERLGALSRALFVKGKQPLALEVALEARRRGGDPLAARVEEAAALDARGLRGVLELWPKPGSLAHQLLTQGLEGPTPAPALEAIYQRGKPTDHRFDDPELGLAAAALWLKGGDLKRAGKVLERLGEGEVAQGQAGLALRGYLARKRGRFEEALGWYERAWEAGQRAGGQP
jgi:tetratricopeptide (TPR) repeat protein